MRTLEREKSRIWVAKRLPCTPELDDDGFPTGNMIETYDDPIELYLNVKPVSNPLERNLYGQRANTSLKVVFTPYDTEGYILEDGDAVWIKKAPNGVLSDEKGMNNDYIVSETVDTGNQIVAYLTKLQGEDRWKTSK